MNCARLHKGNLVLDLWF